MKCFFQEFEVIDKNNDENGDDCTALRTNIVCVHWCTCKVILKM